jgi:hypothetical protein
LAILEAIKQWETARMAGVFTPEVKAVLRDNTREFHLEPASAGGWSLYAAHTERLTYDAGQTTATNWTFQNPHAAQRLQWVVRAVGPRPVQGVTVEINGKPVFSLEDRAVPGGGALRYTGGSEAFVCDSTWKEIARVPVAAEAALIASGAQRIAIACRSQNGSTLKVELRTLGPATTIGGVPRQR